MPIVAVVEDESDFAELYAEWLQDAYRVRTARSSSDAKEIISEDTDVVLLDRILPDISGDELLDWIREEGYPARVAMITGVAPDFDVIEMGFDTYIQKPISRREIRDTVRMLLTRTMYDQRVQHYLELSSKKRVLEEEMTEPELDESADYDRLSSRIREIRAELDYLLRNLDEDYFAAEMETLVGRSRRRRDL